MGRTTGSGLVSFTTPVPTGNCPDGQTELVSDWHFVEGTAEFVARNGDKLCFEGCGQIILCTPDGVNFTASWFGELIVTSGTGRFKHVGPGPDPLEVLAVNDPFNILDEVWTFDYSVVGKIDLGRRR